MKTIALTALALVTTLSSAAFAAPLKLDVFTASPAGFHATSTLIQGEKDAILVDAQFTRSDALRLAAMILESGKTLRTIFITHAHPDHVFGLEILTRQFPDAKVVATAEVVNHIKELAPKKLAEWKPMYGNNLTDTFIVPEVLTADTLELEGQKFDILALKAGESEVASAVYVPQLKTLIAGDLAFNHVHLWLAEGRPDTWIANLERLQKELKLDRVIAGHKAPGQTDAKDLLQQNVAYIRAFEKTQKTGADADTITAKMKAQYPDYQLPIILEIAAKSLATKK